MNPTTEIAEEMRVETKNYSAEFGEAAGGVIMLTTKSGTNKYRGELYTYIQNEALNARDFFAPARGKSRLNQYGGIFSGPIMKNKTFFFVNIERVYTGGSGFPFLTVPTPAQRNGDFSQTLDPAGQLIPIYDPATSVLGPNGQYTRQQFPGNIIPPNRIDPIAARVAAYWPLPNQPGLITGGNNFLGKANNTNHPATDHVRLDHQFTEKQRVYFRYSYNRQTFHGVGPFQGTPGALADPGSILGGDFWPSIAVSWSWAISANTINELRFNRGNTTFHHYRFGNDTGSRLNFAEKLGLENLSPDAFPQFNLSGYAQLGSGAGGWQELEQDAMRAIVFEETLSHRHGQHYLRIGGTWKNSRAIYSQRNFPSGESDYDVRATALPTVAGTGNAFASFITGQVAGGTVQDTNAPDIRTWFAAGFVQDDWRVSRNLTLNLGARYEYDQPKVDVTNSVSFFDPAKTNPVCNCPGAIEFGTDYWNSFRHPRPFYNALKTQIAPRVGFAWTPLNRQDVVIRGGYGIFYTGNDYGDLFWGIPLHGSGKLAQWTSDALGITPAFQLSQGFPLIVSEALSDGFGAVPIGQNPRTTVNWYWPSRTAGYSQQYNLGVQKQFGPNLLEASYLGTSNRKIPTLGVNINEVVPQLRGPGNAQALRPYPQFGNFSVDGMGLSNTLYNGLLLGMRRSFSKGLTFQSSYVWSNNRTAGLFRGVYGRDHGHSGLDVRNRFVWSGVYDLPWGPGRRFFHSGGLGNVLGGWTLGAIVTLQSGTHSTPGSIFNTCNCFASQGVDLVGNATTTRHSNFDPATDTWINTAAFAAPAPYTFGNVAPGLITLPGVNIVDSTITKSIQFNERYRAEFRGEFYNTFNHPNWGAPDLNFGSPTFGRISSTGFAWRGAYRIIQVSTKFYF